MDELGVKPVIGREKELESLLSEFARIGQPRPEMRLGGSECKKEDSIVLVPGVADFAHSTSLGSSAKDFAAWS